MGNKVMSRRIIGRDDWWHSPAAQTLLGWEQRALDQVVSDVFGYHAVQLGLPALEALRENRMPHRWRFGLGVEPAQPWRPMRWHTQRRCRWTRPVWTCWCCLTP